MAKRLGGTSNGVRAAGACRRDIAQPLIFLIWSGIKTLKTLIKFIFLYWLYVHPPMVRFVKVLPVKKSINCQGNRK
jgi:hypothetical protein